jgi:pimeloyl-ACP methyl ester carboxylesterase
MKKLLTKFSILALVLGGAASQKAQQIPFLPELLARIGAFNRLYKEKQTAGQKLPEIESLRAKGAAQFRSWNLVAVLETITEGLSLLQGRPWNEVQKFTSSLTLEVDRTVLEPSQIVHFSLVKMFPSNIGKEIQSQPTVSFEIRPESLAQPNQKLKPILIASSLPIGEVMTSAERKLLLPDGAYSAVAVVEADGKKIAEIKRRIYAVSDFSERIEELSAMASAIKSSKDEKVKALARLLATAEFQLRRLASLTNSVSEDDIDPLAELNRIQGVLSSLGRGIDPFAGERGELERAYQASDGQLIPYRVYVPKAYDGVQAMPLVVMLHGALGDERSYFSDLYDPEVIKGEAERRGYILAAPNGRGRLGGYRGASGEDVLEVIKSVASYYRVDGSRIYLTGHSMGGFGVWLVASRRPDLFAAIAPVSGGAPVPADQLPELLGKLKDIPVMVVHGGRDVIVPPQMSRQMVAAAKKAGLQVTYLEVPEADHLSVVGPTFPQIMDFFSKHKKAQAPKLLGRFLAFSPLI